MSVRKHTSVVLTDDLNRKIEKECAASGEAKSTVIRRVLEQYFRNNIVSAQECGRQIIINLPSFSD